MPLGPYPDYTCGPSFQLYRSDLPHARRRPVAHLLNRFRHCGTALLNAPLSVLLITWRPHWALRKRPPTSPDDESFRSISPIFGYLKVQPPTLMCRMLLLVLGPFLGTLPCAQTSRAVQRAQCLNLHIQYSCSASSWGEAHDWIRLAHTHVSAGTRSLDTIKLRD